MKKQHEKIIREMREKKKSITADEIMPLLFAEEHSSIISRMNDIYVSEDYKAAALEELNQLRRRALYYLKSMENDGIIRLEKRGIKGKKHYVLADGKEKKDIIIQEPRMGYHDEDLKSFIVREQSDSWARKFSSLLIECENNDEIGIMRMLGYSKSISDAISLNEPTAELFSDRMAGMLQKIIVQDSITFSAIISIANITKQNDSAIRFQKMIGLLLRISVLPIISLEISDLRKNETGKLLGIAVEEAKRHKSQLYIHNKDAKRSPVFVGRMGPYTTSENEYNSIKSKLKEDNKALVVGLNNVLCDVESFLKNHSITDLRRGLLLKGTELFIASLNLRRKASDLLPESVFGNNALDIGRDYYRFWNYGLKDPQTDQDTVITLLKSARQTIAGYAHAQSTIYTSCGMPTPFKTAFSVLFEESLPSIFSESQFKKLIIKDIRDLMEKKVQETLLLKQEASDIFNGGDRTRITKRNNNKSSDIVSEIFFIQKSYAIPLVCYDFSHHEKEMTLREFIQ